MIGEVLIGADREGGPRAGERWQNISTKIAKSGRRSILPADWLPAEVDGEVVFREGALPRLLDLVVAQGLCCRSACRVKGEGVLKNRRGLIRLIDAAGNHDGCAVGARWSASWRLCVRVIVVRQHRAVARSSCASGWCCSAARLPGPGRASLTCEVDVDDVVGAAECRDDLLRIVVIRFE